MAELVMEYPVPTPPLTGVGGPFINTTKHTSLLRCLVSSTLSLSHPCPPPASPQSKLRPPTGSQRLQTPTKAQLRFPAACPDTCIPNTTLASGPAT